MTKFNVKFAKISADYAVYYLVDKSNREKVTTSILVNHQHFLLPGRLTSKEIDAFILRTKIEDVKTSR